MRTTPLPVAAAIASLILLFAADARSDGATGQMVVGAHVRPHVRSRITEQPSTLSITREDVDRGFLEVEAARIFVQTNDPAGFLVLATLQGGIFEGAELIGFDEPVVLGAGGGFLHHPFRGTAPDEKALRCRFRIAPDAAPGTYAWPVRITVRELNRRGV